MICRLDDEVRRGRVVRLPADLDPTDVAAAVRTPADSSGSRLTISCPEPSPLHEHVGCIHPEMGLRVRTALAQAARTRGHTTPHDDDLRAARQSLAELAVETERLASYREAMADVDEALEQARAAVAVARGRLQERRENGQDTEPASARLDEALQQLSEVETSAIAARQEFDRERERLRARRDRRERRFRLEDRVANLERQARTALVEQLREEYRTTLSDVSGADPTAEFDADPVSAALAIARLGTVDAPVVLAVDRFDSPAAASEWLDTPVVHL